MPRKKPPLPPPPPPPATTVLALKLAFEKGPLSGQTNQFDPGSTVNVGRIARGNTISVKDSGISSKHLRIRVEDSGSGQFWAVTDLGSSNGTLLNESEIEGSVPVKISDGDLLKIGEETTIRIGFVEIDDASEERGNINSTNGNNLTRRGAKRNAGNKKGKIEELGVIDEGSDLGLGLKDEVGEVKVNGLGQNGENNLDNTIAGRTRRGQNAKKCGVVEVSTSEVEEDEVIVKEVEANKGKKVGTRGKPRNSKKNEDAKMLTGDVGGTSEMASEVEVNPDKNLGGRITRSSKKSNHVEVLANEIDETMEVEIERGRLGTRVTRNSKKVDETLMNSASMNGVENSVVVGVEGVSTRRTRSSRKVENLAEIGNDYSNVIEGRETGKATRGRKKKAPDVSLEENKQFLESEQNVEVQKESEEERISVEKQGEAEVAGTSGVKDDKAYIKGNSILDLEKMTLGEWLDYLETYLPEQIIDTTEEMISEMIQKAEKVHKFMSLHKNDKERTGVDVS